MLNSYHQKMQKVAIVLINFNGKKLLETFLPNIKQYSLSYQIIVIDNGSQDDSLPFLAQNYPDILCIKNHINQGFAKGYNIGLQQILAQYYVLLNTDVATAPNWLAPMLQLMEENPNIAACQPKILSYNEQEKFEYAGAGGGFIDYLGYPFCRGRVFNTVELDHGQYNDIQEIFWASGACMLLRASAFFEVGGFDEQLFAYYEEIDLCWRLQMKGYQIYYCGESTVYHIGSATIGSDNPHKTYLKFRNRALVCYKNTTFCFWKQTLRVFLDFAAILQAIMANQWKNALAIVKAQWDFYKIKKRYKPQTIDRPLKNIYQKLIPFQYYLRGKKTFLDLKAVGTFNP